MSNTPSDPNIVSPKALAGFMRAFDVVLKGKYDLSDGVMTPAPTTQTVSNPRPKASAMVVVQSPRQRFLHWFPPTKAIIRLRDSIRLRKYNEEWIKNNIK